MKKFLLILFNVLALILCFDIKNIYNLYQFRDGAGIGIYIVAGIIELNDRVPYKNVPFYIAALATVVLAVVILDVYILYKKNKAKVI